MVFLKKNGRSSFRSNKRSNFSKGHGHGLSSNIKHRSRGSITQLFDKYLKLAKESSSSGDRIQAEYFNQFADHYSRLMTEYGLKPSGSEKFTYIPADNASEVSIKTNEEINNKDTSLVKKELSEEKNNADENEDIDNSIEAVPFIAKDVKKPVKSKKK